MNKDFLEKTSMFYESVQIVILFFIFSFCFFRLDGFEVACIFGLLVLSDYAHTISSFFAECSYDAQDEKKIAFQKNLIKIERWICRLPAFYIMVSMTLEAYNV